MFAALSGATFTGAVSLPTGSSIVGYSTTTAADALYAPITGSTTYAALGGATFTGAVSLPTGSSIVGYSTTTAADALYAPITGSTNYAPATGSTNYAPITGSTNYAPATGSTIYAALAGGNTIDGNNTFSGTTNTFTGTITGTAGGTPTITGYSSKATADTLYAPITGSVNYAGLASPTFTGTVGLPANQALTTPDITGAITGTGFNLTLAALTGAVTIAGDPTFTGTVSLPATTTIATGATINGYATLANPTFTGTVVLPANQALTTPTLTSPVINTSITGTGFNATLGALSGAVTIGGDPTFSGTVTMTSPVINTSITGTGFNATLGALSGAYNIAGNPTFTGTSVTLPANQALTTPVITGAMTGTGFALTLAAMTGSNTIGGSIVGLSVTNSAVAANPAISITGPARWVSNGGSFGTATSGNVEFDGTNLFITGDTSATGNGRNVILAAQYGHMTTGAAVTSGSPFFGANFRPALIAGHTYSFKYILRMTKTGNNGITFSFSNSAGTTLNLAAVRTVLVDGAALAAVGNIGSISALNATTTTSATTGNISASISTFIEGSVVATANTRLDLIVTTAGTITSVAGSSFTFTDMGTAATVGNIG
jgi:hypothetical protein